MNQILRVSATALLWGTLLGGCSDIYVRDGVTSGNRFQVAPHQLLSDDPVVQSWVSYSLTKSLCQLELGTDNPARANSYGCELSSRIALLDEWSLHLNTHPDLRDEYLDTLAAVREEAFLDEYVAHYFGRSNWRVPAEVDTAGFSMWRRRHLRGHTPETRIIGSWTYSNERHEAER